MDKNIWQSKTVWGFGLALAVAGLQSMGLIDQTVISELVKYLSGIFGVYGARDALAD